MRVGPDRLALGAVSAIFLFGTATTFQTLGLALFAMQAEFGWSEAQTGGAFTALGLSCCCLSLLPVALLPRIGGRWTTVSGCLGLAAAFALAAAARDVPTTYAAAALLGMGYSLVANTPGIYLIAGWFGPGSPRMIGLYLTIGTSGAAIGPPIVQGLIYAHGWRVYWLAMVAVAAVLAALCAVSIAEPPPASVEQAGIDKALPDGPASTTARPRRTRDALLGRPFLVIAASMVLTQTCLLTVSGVAPAHLASLGWSTGAAARFLGAQGLVGTIGTAAAGWLADRIHPRTMQAAGLLGQAAGLALLAFAGNVWMIIASAIAFGLGWSITCLAITVFLIRLFGTRTGTTALSTVWMLSGLAAAGPWAAGLWSDRTGSFIPAFCTLSLLALPLTLATTRLRG